MNSYHTLEIQKIASSLGTDPAKGLSLEDSRNRLEKYGPNVIEAKKKTSALIIFLEQFNDFMIWVLIAAALISGLVLGEFVDSAVIGVVLFLNAILGFIQTFRAEKALEALKALAAPTATVIRGAKELTIKAEMLVPGDIILLQSGDKVPADVRLVKVASLQTLEAALTGESTPVNKFTEELTDPQLPVSERKNMAFTGTSIGRGRGKAIVVATGRATEMGKIAELIEADEEPTPLQKELKKVGFRIALAVIFIALLVFVVGSLKGNPLATMFLIAVALSVAAIPESLPAIVTITLAIGVQYMARKNAIVRRLHAVETLGSTNFIATDKTGTLTLNEMTAVRLFTDNALYSIKESHILDEKGQQARPSGLEKIMQTAVLANDSRKQPDTGTYIGEPTELALVQAGQKFGFEKTDLENKFKRVDELPFESERKRMTTVHKLDGKYIAFTKGAVEVLLNESATLLQDGNVISLTESQKEQLMSVANKEASAGYRVLGFAYKEFDQPPKMEDLEKNLVFVGMMGLLDPPRPEVFQAIKTAQNAGIKIAMVTGDHLLTATKIASEVGLLNSNETLTGRELQELTSHQLAQKVEKISVFARVDPIHKVKIVEALKEKGYIVAVTGDGVNDAPALKKADIGVAMGITGTDVSKEASSMILADDNFATIIKAIKQGRKIFDNLRKFISFLLSANVSEVLTIFLGILFFPAGITLLLPIQILWINLVTDAFPALALGVDPAEPGIMKRRPRKKEEGILTANQAFRITTEGVFLTLAALGVAASSIWWFKMPEAKIETLVFTTLVLIQLVHAFNYRSAGTIFSLETFKNNWLLLAFIGSFALQLAVVYIPFLQPFFNTMPLNLKDWALIIIATLAAEVLIDISKMTFFASLAVQKQSG